MSKRITGKERYKKERTRIMSATREARKAGYIVDIELPTVKQVEKSGKNFASLNRKLGKIKGKEVGKLKVIDTETGEVITLKEARRIIRETPTVTMIDTVRDWVDTLPDYRDFYYRRSVSRIEYASKKNILMQLLDNAVKEEGIRAVENRLTQNEERIKERIDALLYDSDSSVVETSFIAIAVIIKGTQLSMSEASEISDLGDVYGYEET